MTALVLVVGFMSSFGMGLVIGGLWVTRRQTMWLREVVVKPDDGQAERDALCNDFDSME